MLEALFDDKGGDHKRRPGLGDKFGQGDGGAPIGEKVIDQGDTGTEGRETTSTLVNMARFFSSLMRASSFLALYMR